MAGYTHVQQAQPISVAYWLSHYAAILIRDLDRIKRAYDITDENPLGAGALAGTSFPIDRKLTTSLLGFQKVHDHGLDATSSRDFMLETLSANSILMTTISRLAEEFVLWSSWEFRSITLDDGFAMGSSMMPNKKNPGTCELLRGRTGRINGSLLAGLTLMKGLPSGYNRDFHEDKEVLIDSLSLIIRAVEVLPPLVESTTLNLPRMAELANANFSTATELANYLVLRHNIPFRQAHHIVGSLVGELTRKGENFANTAYCFNHLKKNGVNAPEKEVLAVLDPKSVVLSYTSLGGTGPAPVKEMLKNFSSKLDEHRKILSVDKARVNGAFEDARTIAGHVDSIKTAEDIGALIKKYHHPKA
jgi:argininosuccinate lyase